MPELDTSGHAVKGPLIERETIREKLYVLLAVFLSSRPITAFCEDVAWCNFRKMMDEMEERLVIRNLIECAVMIRMADDVFEQQMGVKSNASVAVVGKLWPDTAKQLVTGLSLREACNKIIHAKLINFDVSRQKTWHRRYLRPRLYLHGKRAKESWKAELDIKQFVNDALELMQ